ncbi:hypothetical protein GBAR_LOCUS30907 [Geodia barretti]|uniref:Uncharacterized protein n=1 Tax=Geodia barretti TaxID=519541 RepID=A0AA35XGM1_GEOBA|nr:hypothetical protein GBAR_LOCUS30907 [Geodia barretti]
MSLTTPETNKTVSITGGCSAGAAGLGPTPKNEFKKPFLKQKQYFMSPTDAMVSPCTQKLQTSRLLQKRPPHHRSKVNVRPALANKENDKRKVGDLPTIPQEDEPDPEPTPQDS